MRGDEKRTIDHDDPPEHIIFMSVARTEMLGFFEVHGFFPSTWFELGMTFSNSPYSRADPSVYPREEDGDRWKPRGCHFMYEIAKSGAEDFLIRALEDDVPRYEIDRESRLPRALEETDEVESTREAQTSD